MLDRRADHLKPGGTRLECAENREVIGLGAAAGENHLARVGRNERGNLGPRSLEHAPRRLPLAMNRRRITASYIEETSHGGLRLRSKLRAGVMVKVGAHRSCMRKGARDKLPYPVSAQKIWHHRAAKSELSWSARAWSDAALRCIWREMARASRSSTKAIFAPECRHAPERWSGCITASRRRPSSRCSRCAISKTGASSSVAIAVSGRRDSRSSS